VTAIKKRLRELDRRRKNAAFFGGIVGGIGGLLLSFDLAVALFAGAAGSLSCWYLASLSYWEYREAITLNRRKK